MGSSKSTMTTYRPASKKKFHLNPAAPMRIPPKRGPGSLIEVMPMALASVGICSTIFVIVLFIMFNSTPVVMAAGRELSYMLLTGCVLCYFMTFVLLATPSTFVCGAQRFGVGFGFSVVYSSLLIKTNRISRIFESARRSAKRPPFISPKSQIVMTCVLIVMQVLFTSVWLLVEPPGTRLHSPDSREPIIILKCSSDDISFLVSLVYNILLIIILFRAHIDNRLMCPLRNFVGNRPGDDFESIREHGNCQ